MGQLSFCDICQCPIKPNSKKYAVVMQEIIEVENKDYKNAMEYIEHSRQYGALLKVQEICEKCKKIYDHLFQLRKDEIAKLNEEIKKSYKDPKLLENKTNNLENEFCSCLEPDPDWGDIDVASGFVRCKICGKLINPYDKPQGEV